MIDPIDPAFHSPSRRTSVMITQNQPPAQIERSTQVQTQGQRAGRTTSASLSPPSVAVPKPPVPVSSEPKDKAGEEGGEGDVEEDVEKAGRRTIAERMAKLGGIKFGAAPVPRKISGEHAEVEKNEGEKEVQEVQSGGDEGPEEQEDEEEERARRERIAAKLAGMGGMRIGMMPMSVPPRQTHVLREEQPQPAQAPVEERPVPPGSGASESGVSDDGVKVEAEESEIEEVGYDDVKGSEEGSGEEVPPPPPPARPPNRRGTGASTTSAASASTSPPVPTRPPVPVPAPFRRTSVQSTTTTKKGQLLQSQQSEYVMVDDPKPVGEEYGEGEGIEEDVPPPPPARPANRAPPPARAAPPVPVPASSMVDSISSQWELPAIPSSSLGGDLSASWSEAMLDEQQPAPPTSQAVPVPVPPPVSAPPPKLLEALHLGADELMAMWGRVGVQICEVATTMYEQSKKNLVGDGTYRGFVNTVLAEVPNAAKPQSKQIPYGYLVYLQNGAQVQKRASEIMPGDIVEIVDAKFKGHKGLGGYQQHVGTGVEGGEGGGPVIAVVNEFEPKKSKVRVLQANQHVGQQVSCVMLRVRKGMLMFFFPACCSLLKLRPIGWMI